MRSEACADRWLPVNESPAIPAKQTAVFVDRDGTLHPDVRYLSSPDALELFPHVPEAVFRLNRAGIKVILVTNQSGIARGYFSLKDLEAVHEKLKAGLASAKAWLDDVLFCPHHPDDGCRCRKPNPGMIEQATTRYAINVSHSYVVGDQPHDLEMAHRVGAKGVLVMTGPNSHESLAVCRTHNTLVDFVAPCFSDAVSWILRDWTQSPERRLH